MENVINLIKDLAKDTILNNKEVADDKKELAIETATGALTQGLSGNLSGLAGLLSGGGDITNTLKNTVASALTEKAGLSSALSGTIASGIISLLVSSLSGKSEKGGLGLDSLMEALSGGDKSNKGGLLDSLGGLFGK